MNFTAGAFTIDLWQYFLDEHRDPDCSLIISETVLCDFLNTMLRGDWSEWIPSRFALAFRDSGENGTMHWDCCCHDYETDSDAYLGGGKWATLAGLNQALPAWVTQTIDRINAVSFAITPHGRLSPGDTS